MGVSTKFIRGFSALAFLVILCSYQNCSVYETDDRKVLNTEGVGPVEDCFPYLDATQAVEVFASDKARSQLVTNNTTGIKTCNVSISGQPNVGLDYATCSISPENVEKAQTPPVEGQYEEMLLTSSPNTQYFYAYSRKETVGSGANAALNYFVIFVGARNGASEGINCGFTFTSLESYAAARDAVKVRGQNLVDTMVQGTK